MPNTMPRTSPLITSGIVWWRYRGRLSPDPPVTLQWSNTSTPAPTGRKSNMVSVSPRCRTLNEAASRCAPEVIHHRAMLPLHRRPRHSTLRLAVHAPPPSIRSLTRPPPRLEY
ncbi:hypothetical protein CBL_04081 [Carabus blaptoides fortunei]